MMREREKQEWLTLATSESLRDDMRRLAGSRHNPFLKDGSVDLDRYMEFLNVYNEFVNHAKKPFKPIKGCNMKL